ncbi:VanW family protein [Candidatus Dojkabacteria bacterium]|nr:VanW family protein [Candidatus Dojkabacteria bacterium]
MHITVLLKNLLLSVFICSLIVVSGLSVTYILTNTVWANKVLPNTSIKGVDISLSDKEKLVEIYQERYSLPQTVKISIGEITKELVLTEIKAKYSPSPEEILAEGKIPLDKFIEDIDSVYVKKDLVPKVAFDEGLLQAWIYSSFQEVKFVPKRIPSINKNIDGEIVSCEEGNEGLGMPIEDVKNSIINYEVNDSFGFQLVKYGFSPDEREIARICGKYNELLKKLAYDADYQVIRNWELKDIFAFSESGANLKVKIEDESKLKTALQRVASEKNREEGFPEVKIYAGTAFFLGEYVSSKELDIEKSIKVLKDKLVNPDKLDGFKLFFNESSYPYLFEGLPILSYSELVSKGEAKFKYEKWRDTTIASINKGLRVLDGRIIPADYKYSLIDNGLEARTYLYNENGPQQMNQGNYSYNVGICGVATAMYRAVLMAGLPIIERNPHKQALKSYTYPYGGLVDAALYFRADIKQDLKFKNDYNQNLLIVTESKLEDGDFKYSIRLFAPSGLVKREVRLDDFWRENVPKGVSFNEQFTRYVDGVPEVIKTKYYINEL